MSWSPRLRKKLSQLRLADETWQIGCVTSGAAAQTRSATPVQAVDDERLRGSYQLTVEGAEVMRSGYRVPPAGRLDG